MLSKTDLWVRDTDTLQLDIRYCKKLIKEYEKLTANELTIMFIEAYIELKKQDDYVYTADGENIKFRLLQVLKSIK